MINMRILKFVFLRIEYFLSNGTPGAGNYIEH